MVGRVGTKKGNSNAGFVLWVKDGSHPPGGQSSPEPGFSVSHPFLSGELFLYEMVTNKAARVIKKKIIKASPH